MSCQKGETSKLISLGGDRTNGRCSGGTHRSRTATWMLNPPSSSSFGGPFAGRFEGTTTSVERGLFWFRREALSGARLRRPVGMGAAAAGWSASWFSSCLRLVDDVARWLVDGRTTVRLVDMARLGSSERRRSRRRREGSSKGQC